MWKKGQKEKEGRKGRERKSQEEKQMKARKKCIKDKKQIWKTSLKGTRQRKRLRKRLRKAKIKIVKPRTFRFLKTFEAEKDRVRKRRQEDWNTAATGRWRLLYPFYLVLPEVTQSKAVEVKGRVERSKNQDQSTTQATSKCYFDQLVLPLAVSCGQVLLPAVFLTIMMTPFNTGKPTYETCQWRTYKDEKNLKANTGQHLTTWSLRIMVFQLEARGRDLGHLGHRPFNLAHQGFMVLRGLTLSQGQKDAKSSLLESQSPDTFIKTMAAMAFCRFENDENESRGAQK